MKLTTLKKFLLCVVITHSLAGTTTYAHPRLKPPTNPDSPSKLLPEDPWISRSIDIAVDNYDKYTPVVAYNIKQNDYLAVWVQYIKDGETAIYARRVSVDGKPKGSAFPIRHSPGKEFMQPVVVYQPGQDLFWIYYTYKENSANHNILLSWLPGNSNSASHFAFSHDWPWNWYSTLTYNNQAGELLVVYEKYLDSFSRTIEADVLKLFPLERIDETNIAGVFPEMRRFPDVVYNQTLDQYLAAYTKQVPYDAKSQATGRLISGNREWFSKEHTFAEKPAAEQDDLALVAGKDEYLAVWHEIESTTTSGIWGRRITKEGLAGAPIKISSTLDQKRYEPDVAYLNEGYYLVVWRYNLPYDSQTFQRIFGAFIEVGQDRISDSEFRIESGGSILSSRPEFPVNGLNQKPDYPQDDPINQRRPAVACSQSTACLVVFEENDPGPIYNIHGYMVGLHKHTYLPLVLSK